MRVPAEAYPMLAAVETHLPHLSRAQQDGLVWWVYGTVLAGSACQGAVATALGDRLVVLAVSVLYRGSAIPVAWHVTAAGRPGAWLAPILEVLAALAPGVPPTTPVLVLADRSLWSPRLRECGGRDTAATVDAGGLLGGGRRLAAAFGTDLLERDRESLPVEEGRVTLPVRGRGLATARLMIESGGRTGG